MNPIGRKTILITTLSLSAAALAAFAYQEHAAPDGMNPHSMHSVVRQSHDMSAMHAVVSTLSFTELQQTASDLERARQATAKFQDVHAAEAAGYQKLGGDFPGMGTHFVLTMEAGKFDVEKPPILLYVKGADGGDPAGGVAALYDAAAGAGERARHP